MILEILLVILAFVILVILAAIGKIIGQYNIFRNGQQDIKTQWSNVLTEYQRRADAFYNWVQVVKSYKRFEKSTLVQVIQARSSAINLSKHTDKTVQMKNMKGLDSFFSKLMVLTENYPTLKADKQHDKLMDEIRITEDRINVARTDYNEIVGDYNKQILYFPGNIIAGMFHFTVEQFFVNEEETSKAPKINLED